ncbi:MAG: hypothetical protein ACYSTL_04890 [Planctomycetota bacterium]
MHRSMSGCALVLLVALSPVFGESDEKIELGEPADFPHAGIALAVPNGFEFRQVNELSGVMRAVRTKNDQIIQSINLSAFVVDDDMSLERFIESMLDGLRNDLAVRQLSILKETPMDVAKTRGTARRLSYSFRGQQTQTAMVCFIRQLISPKLRICYLLTVECGEADCAKLLPIFGQVVGSVSLTAVRRPAEIPVGELADAIDDFQRGYSIRPPLGWFASQSPPGILTGLCDYLRGGVALPQLQVVVAEVSPETNSETCAKSWLLRAREGIEQNHLLAEVLSEGAVKLANRDAYQFILLQSPKPTAASNPSTAPTSAPATAPTTAPATAPTTAPASRPVEPIEPVIIAQRTLCVSDSEGKTRSYSLVLLYGGEDGKAAAEMLERLSEGFSLLTAAPEAEK